MIRRLPCALVLSLSCFLSRPVYSTETIWPLVEKKFSHCAFKVPGSYLEGFDCTEGAHSQDALPAAYRELAAQLSRATSESTYEELSEILHAQPKRRGREMKIQIGRDQVRSRRFEWQIPADLVPKEARLWNGWELERAVFAQYIDGHLLQVQIIVAPFWIYTISVSGTKCILNCKKTDRPPPPAVPP